MGKTIYILSCTSTKVKDAKTVETLYTGPMFVKGLAYAKRHHAKHILVIGGVCKSEVYELSDKASFYDGLDIKELHKADRLKLAKKRLDSLKAKGCDTENDNFIFLTGQSYYEFLLADQRNALPDAIKHYELPFRENKLKGNGDINHFLDNN
ncbi:MAG: hypothetical protein K5867_09755 [Bacteroidales bacterium]|nr:hypothetical protein [Bacteroidales bacterium]